MAKPFQIVERDCPQDVTVLNEARRGVARDRLARANQHHKDTSLLLMLAKEANDKSGGKRSGVVHIALRANEHALDALIDATEQARALGVA